KNEKHCVDCLKQLIKDTKKILPKEMKQYLVNQAMEQKSAELEEINNAQPMRLSDFESHSPFCISSDSQYVAFIPNINAPTLQDKFVIVNLINGESTVVSCPDLESIKHDDALLGRKIQAHLKFTYDHKLYIEGLTEDQK